MYVGNYLPMYTQKDFHHNAFIFLIVKTGNN